MAKAVVLINTGSVYSTDRKEYLSFIRRFLSDRHVVHLPLWLRFLLFYIILPLRSKTVAIRYKTIFKEGLNPYFEFSSSLADKLNARHKGQYEFYMSHSYCRPFVEDVVKTLKKRGIKEADIIFIPLYPQSCRATTQASINIINKALVSVFKNPLYGTRSIIKSYCYKDFYIKALADRIKQYYISDTHLVFSYHSMLRESIEDGDSYQTECERTTEAVISCLGLDLNHVSHCYQSPAGRKSDWIGPFLSDTLADLACRGVKDVAVISPAFSIDCLETLYEIELENRDLFIKAGGRNFIYIPALNDSIEHVSVISSLIESKNHD